MKPIRITDALPNTVDMFEKHHVCQCYLDVAEPAQRLENLGAYKSMLITYALLRKDNPWRSRN